MDRTCLPLPRPASNPALRPPPSSTLAPLSTAHEGSRSGRPATTRTAKPTLSRQPSVPIRTSKREPPSAGNGSGLARPVSRPAGTTSSAGRRTFVGTVPLATTGRPASTVGMRTVTPHTATFTSGTTTSQPTRRLLSSRSALGLTGRKPAPPSSTAQAGVLGPKRTVASPSSSSVVSLRSCGTGVRGDGAEKGKMASGKILSGLGALVKSPEKVSVSVGGGTRVSESPQRARAGLMGYGRPAASPPSPTRIPSPSRVPSPPALNRNVSHPPPSQRTPPPPATAQSKPEETPLLPRMVSASAAALRASAASTGTAAGDEQLMDTELSFIDEDSGDGDMHGDVGGVGVGVGGRSSPEDGQAEDDLDFSALGPVKSRFGSSTSFFQTTPVTAAAPRIRPDGGTTATSGAAPATGRVLAFRHSPHHPNARPWPTRLPTPTRTPRSASTLGSVSSNIAPPTTLSALPSTTATVPVPVPAPAPYPSTTPLKRALAQATHQLTTTRALLDSERAAHSSALAKLARLERLEAGLEAGLEEEERERRWEEVRKEGEGLLEEVRKGRGVLREMIEELERGHGEEGDREA